MASASRAAAENEVLSDFREEVRRWRWDPVNFVEHVLGVTTLTPYAVQILEALRDHPRVAVAACHDSGKTHSASCAAWWWALSFQPSKVSTTAPTDRQVKQLLWSEIRSRRALARIALPGEVQVTHWQYPGGLVHDGLRDDAGLRAGARHAVPGLPLAVVATGV